MGGVIIDGWFWLQDATAPPSDNPTAFDVWASIVLPAFVGVGTLALALASVYVAWKSHETSKAAVKEAARANDITQHQYAEAVYRNSREERKRISAEIIAWFRVASLAASQGQDPVESILTGRETMDRSVEVYHDQYLSKFVRTLAATVVMLGTPQVGKTPDDAMHRWGRELTSAERELESWMINDDHFMNKFEHESTDAESEKREKPAG